MTWEKALEAHVQDNHREFDAIGGMFVEMREFVSTQIADVNSRIDRLRAEMNGRFEAVDSRFDAIDRRFEAVDSRFDAVDRRFEAVDQRFDAIDARFDSMERRLERRFDRLDGQIEVIVKMLTK